MIAAAIIQWASWPAFEALCFLFLYLSALSVGTAAFVWMHVLFWMIIERGIPWRWAWFLLLWGLLIASTWAFGQR